MSVSHVRIGDCYIGDLVYFKATCEVGVIVSWRKPDSEYIPMEVKAFWAGPMGSYHDHEPMFNLPVTVLVGR